IKPLIDVVPFPSCGFFFFFFFFFQMCIRDRYIAGAIITMLKIASFNNRKDKIVFIIFSLSLMIVYSLPYQASSIGIIIGLYLIKFNEKISEERVK
ncbi:hypothetical protein, partial [Vibrio chemaguriensis]|uniref:hypothetical protein n=1 Tax=Vibrio chemaguriensis TaxID=2527672 RepID=UPI0019D64FA6